MFPVVRCFCRDGAPARSVLALPLLPFEHQVRDDAQRHRRREPRRELRRLPPELTRPAPRDAGPPRTRPLHRPAYVGNDPEVELLEASLTRPHPAAGAAVLQM